MSYITQADLEAFEKKYAKEGDGKPQEYCEAAMEMIKNYLGYSPERQQYITLIKGDDGKLAALKAKNITSISSLQIDGVEKDPALLEVENDNYICFVDGSSFRKGSRYVISYTAGFYPVPKDIKTTALQLAALLWESGGGNLAVSSTSFADTGSRVFNNFTADRFLKQIAFYKKAD